MILITGASGLLGSELKRQIGDENGYFTERSELDITNLMSIENYVKEKEIKYIINCAAGSNAEQLEDDIEWARSISVDGPRNLAKVATKIGATLIHISTDYVFDGKKNTPYCEEDLTNGLSVYGRVKAEGEQEVLKYAKSSAVIRTAWLYSEQGKDFIAAIRRVGSSNSEIKVVNDQVGSPCYIPDLARHIIEILPKVNESNKGIYHLTNEGICSWYDLACFITKYFNLKCKVKPVSSNEYATKAKRPNYSVLSKEKIKKVFGIEIRHYHESLMQCFNNISKNETD